MYGGRAAVREEVRACHLEKGEKQRAEHRERDRTEQNDEWVAETVELRGEHQKDQHNGEYEGGKKFISLRAQLPRVAGVIENVAFGQNLVRFVFEKFKCRIKWRT